MNIEILRNKKIGISLSGGADSALLAFILMNHYEDDLHFFTYASQEKSFRTVKNSILVIERCIEFTKKINCHHHIKYGQQQQRDTFFNFLLDSVDSKIIDVMYTGTTSAPPNYVQENFKQQLPEDIKTRRDQNRIKQLYTHNGRLFHPLINFSKKEIFSMYRNLDILDKIYPVTNSCENLHQHSGHCGQCWWCEERLWAFRTIN
jgi:7-cyano-7-deazaguanine synthase in queuosine biosynthesis